LYFEIMSSLELFSAFGVMCLCHLLCSLAFFVAFF
jgi:hypothetical protein